MDVCTLQRYVVLGCFDELLLRDAFVWYIFTMIMKPCFFVVDLRAIFPSCAYLRANVYM